MADRCGVGVSCVGVVGGASCEGSGGCADCEDGGACDGSGACEDGVRRGVVMSVSSSLTVTSTVQPSVKEKRSVIELIVLVCMTC